jgi:hypothetical protein
MIEREINDQNVGRFADAEHAVVAVENRFM